MNSDTQLAEQGPSQVHIVKAGKLEERLDKAPDIEWQQKHSAIIREWLSDLFQAEHLNLLVGSGLTTAVGNMLGAEGVCMNYRPLTSELSDAVEMGTRTSAERLGRGTPNLEDQIRIILQLIGGLKIIALAREGTDEIESVSQHANELAKELQDELNNILKALFVEILNSESHIDQSLSKDEQSSETKRVLAGFFRPFANRPASRERLHIFTTNYDRLIEHCCDLLGLHILDRFVGNLMPVFRSTRLRVDVHYNPPGIRGEPRYLEGVVRFSKLHGSVDWKGLSTVEGATQVQRIGIPFGDAHAGSKANMRDTDSLIIYPKPAKESETLEYPYAELFRDFASSVCQPNSVLVTYGYGFGDEHINRVLLDMLNLSSTHLVILSYDDASGRLFSFLRSVRTDSQISILMGPGLAELSKLVDHYLPRPIIGRYSVGVRNFERYLNINDDSERTANETDNKV